MTKPKLLLAADTNFPKVDGTLKFMQEFIKRSHQEFDISLLLPDLGKRTKFKGIKEITLIKPSNWFHISGYPSMKLSWRNIKKIKKAVQEAEIVFVQGPALISYFSIYYGAKYKKKTVFYTHTIIWELFEQFFPPFFNKLFLKMIKRVSMLFYNHCQAILVPYHELKEQLSKAGIKQELIVAKLGVDINKFSPAANPQKAKEKIRIDHGKKIIGYVGRISREKNTLVLLKAFKQLPEQKEVHLLMVGDGPEDQVKPFEELKNCTVTGFVDNVQDYLQAMDVFVMPSLTETTSLATLEAMSSGVPVITTKIGFMKNYIVKNHNGIFFPKNSSSTLAIKIQKILDNQSFRESLKQNARRTIIYSFSWERSINKIKRALIKIHLK